MFELTRDSFEECLNTTVGPRGAGEPYRLTEAHIQFKWLVHVVEVINLRHDAHAFSVPKK